MTRLDIHPSLAYADPDLLDTGDLDDPRNGLARVTSDPRLSPVDGFRSWINDGSGRFFPYAPQVEQRQFASNTYPTYPGGGPQLTVDASLRFPQLILRALTDLTYQRFVADRIFMRGSAAQVAGGAAVFQRAETLFPDRGAEEVGIRSEWPRSGWTVPDLFAAAVKQYGLETPIHDLSIRRNQIDVLARAQRKIANALVKFVDATAMATIIADAAVQTTTATATWNNAGAKIITDLANLRGLIQNVDLGYVMDTLIINPAQETSMLIDANVSNILPRESGIAPQATGVTVPIMGLKQIIATNQLTAGTVIALQSGVVGTIADEAPDPRESYVGYNPGAGQANLFVKTYRDDDEDTTIVRGARFPAMWIAEPKSAAVMTGA